MAATHVVTTHLDVVDAGDGKLSLREALQQAQNGDTITFAESPFSTGTSQQIDYNTISIVDELVVDKNLVIDGDINDDGVGDVYVSTVDSTAAIGAMPIHSLIHVKPNVTVTIEGLTLTSIKFNDGPNHEPTGAWGDGGSEGVDGSNGAHYQPVSIPDNGGSGEAGASGTSGTAGDAANSFAAGGIYNEGNLTLRNVAITGITATGGDGGSGGSGGWGGAGGNGHGGVDYVRDQNGNIQYEPELVWDEDLHQWVPKRDAEGHIVYTDVPILGGLGNLGNPGGDGGHGGHGGHGAAAGHAVGGVYNTGSLILEGDIAIAGNHVVGGRGGTGGIGGAGGIGGSGTMRTVDDPLTENVDEGDPLGGGGRGGNGGNGGNGGTGGNAYGAIYSTGSVTLLGELAAQQTEIVAGVAGAGTDGGGPGQGATLEGYGEGGEDGVDGASGLAGGELGGSAAGLSDQVLDAHSIVGVTTNFEELREGTDVPAGASISFEGPRRR